MKKYQLEIEHKWPGESMAYAASAWTWDEGTGIRGNYICCEIGSSAEEAEKKLVEKLKIEKIATWSKIIEI